MFSDDGGTPEATVDCVALDVYGCRIGVGGRIYGNARAAVHGVGLIMAVYNLVTLDFNVRVVAEDVYAVSAVVHIVVLDFNPVVAYHGQHV